MIIVVVVVTVLSYMFYSEYSKRNYWKNKNVNSPKPFPFVGHFLPFLTKRKSLAEMLDDIYYQYDGRYVGIHLFSVPILLVKDLEIYKQIFIKNFDHFTDRHVQFSEKMDPLFANSLTFLNGQKWRDMRSTLSPAFSSSKMKGMFLLMKDSAERLNAHLANQIKNYDILTIDSKNIFARYAVDTVANIAFGVNSNAIENEKNEFFQISKKAINLKGIKSFIMFLYQISTKAMDFLSIPVIKQEYQDYFRSVFMDSMNHREKTGTDRMDMIHLIMEARKNRKTENGSTVPAKNLKDLTDTELIAQAFLFLSTGSDPTTAFLTFCAYELARNKDIQEKLHKEIDNLKNDLDGEISYEKLMNMKYLDMVINETLRKWPVGVIQERACLKPFSILPENSHDEPIALEKGTDVMVSTFHFHRNPKYFKDPLKFDPERFNEENRKNIIPYSFMPFGFGPRNCIGARFATLEIKTLVYYLFSTFEIVAVKNTPKEINLAKLDVILDSEDTIWLGLRKRNK